MKKRILGLGLAMTAMLALAGTAQAADNNGFYFTDAAVLPGETTSIELCMKNVATDLTCFEAEIQLPAGLSLVCDEEGNPIATLYANRISGHEMLTNALENGNLKLLVSSINGNLFRGEEGPLLSFLVQASPTAPLGEFSVETVGESLLVNSAADAYYSVGVTGNVLITDDATNIKSIDNGQSSMGNDEAIYDLSGRKISEGQSSLPNGRLKRGIFIKAGKKIANK